MNRQQNKMVVVIAGPTAVGKTAVAIELARKYNTGIISADSRQCYRELKIGVARPSEEELAVVKHHFIASHSIHDEVTAAGFEQYALQKASELFQQHNIIVMVGGTGLYIKAFCEGLDPMPAVDPVVREMITRNFEEHGIEWLSEQLKQKDPAFFNTGEIKNPRRMMRALEFFESNGSSILAYRKNEKAARDFNVIKLGLTIPKEELHGRIHRRTEQMITDGLIDEVRSLLPWRHLNALQTVGYTELFDHFDGRLTLKEAIERIETATRQYAKRQLTWFRKEESMHWSDPSNLAGITAHIKKNL